MGALHLSTAIWVANLLRFVIVETAITLIAVPLFTKTLENLCKRGVTSGQAIQERKIDLGWLTPVSVAYYRISTQTLLTLPQRGNELNPQNWDEVKRFIAVAVKLVIINALLLTAYFSIEISADAVSEKVVVKRPIMHHSNLKRSLAEVTVHPNRLLKRVIEVQNCTQDGDALHFQTAEGLCRARELGPSAWATLRGRKGEFLESNGNQSLIQTGSWTNDTFEATTISIEGHEDTIFFWSNNQVYMYCHDLREKVGLEVGLVSGHCAVMLKDAPDILHLVKVHRTTNVSDLKLTVDRSEYTDVLGVKLGETHGALNEIMFASVTIAKRHLVLGVSITEGQIIQEYYTGASTVSRILRTMIDGYGGDAVRDGEYYVERLLATQSTWSVIFLGAVILLSVVACVATRQNTRISVPFDFTSVMKKLSIIDEVETCSTTGNWPVIYSSSLSKPLSNVAQEP